MNPKNKRTEESKAVSICIPSFIEAKQVVRIVIH